MALTDHIIDSKKVSEEQIEAIIDGRARYDLQTKSIVLLTPGRNLTIRGKILLYLVALRGWDFIDDSNTRPAHDVSPKELSLAIGVVGSTLRPILMNLVNDGLVIGRDARYEISAHALPNILALITDPARPTEALNASRPPVRTHRPPKNSSGVPASEGKRGAQGKKVKLGGSVAGGLDRLLNENWFREGKTISELQTQLGDNGVPVEMYNLSGVLLRAVRRQRLERRREPRGNKTVYVYTQPMP